MNYITETFEQKIGGRVITVTNLTPEFSTCEKRKIKLLTQAKLYDVFVNIYPVNLKEKGLLRLPCRRLRFFGKGSK